MNDIARRTIEELLVRYDLEPDLQDIYVEGYFDKEIYSSCLAKAKCTSRALYVIDVVDIPFGLLCKHGLSEGNKQRVIVLARELASLTARKCAFLCVVDRDLDHWFGPLETCNSLRWSKYCSVELFFLTEEIIRSIVLDACRIRVKDYQVFYQSLIETLTALYLFRLVDYDLKMKLEWVSVDRCLSRSGDSIVFDSTGYVRKVLQQNSKTKNSDLFMKTLSDWKNKVSGDPRLFIRGHDLTGILAWSVQKFSGIREMSHSIAVERLMILLAGHHPEILAELTPNI